MTDFFITLYLFLFQVQLKFCRDVVVDNNLLELHVGLLLKGRLIGHCRVGHQHLATHNYGLHAGGIVVNLQAGAYALPYGLSLFAGTHLRILHCRLASLGAQLLHI